MKMGPSSCWTKLNMAVSKDIANNDPIAKKSRQVMKFIKIKRVNELLFLIISQSAMTKTENDNVDSIIKVQLLNWLSSINAVSGNSCSFIH